jgi:acetyl-CoA carboxylase alpha subunit
MKTSLNDELVEKLEALTEKEEFEAKVKELADGIEELKNTTKQRKSEVDEEVVKSNRNQPKRLNKNFNTLA